MTDNLKPVRCGCGGEAKVVKHEYYMCSPTYGVTCYKCGTATNQGFYSETESIEAWNRAMGATDTNVGNKWILCSERLPKNNGCYLVWRPHFFGGEFGMPAICYFDGQNTWHDSYGVDFERILHNDDVIAWMPLPEPWRGEE